MNMKKLSRKIVLSLIAILFAVITLGTSTYAWLSMNNQVTATGMQVTAKADSRFLLIATGDNDTVAEIQAISPAPTTVALTVSSAESEVYPSAHNPETGSVVTTGGALVTNTTTASAVGNWYYKRADLPTASQSTTDAVALTSSNFASYVIHKTVYITLSQGSTQASNLKVSATMATNNTKSGSAETFAAVKCLVTTSTAVTELSAGSVDASGKVSSNTVLAATVTDAAVVQVDIFIYYDGNDSTVYTTNIANLEGATIDLTFSVDE